MVNLFFLCSSPCSSVLLESSKREVVLKTEPFSRPRPKGPSDFNGLYEFGEGLNEIALNEAMKLLGGSFDGRAKACLLDGNEVIMSKSYEQLSEYAMGYGLTELLRSLLFRYAGWETDFERHVYAARLYKKEGFPIEEWQNQEGLDWDSNYQAIFKADNPELLTDVLFYFNVTFQKGDKSSLWVGPTKESIEFIKKHLRRLIIRYDSARILRALYNSEFASFLPFGISIKGIRAAIKSSLVNDNRNLHVSGYNWRLRVAFGMKIRLDDAPTYYDIEYVTERGLFKTLESDIYSHIRLGDCDWTLEMLYRRGLVKNLTEEFIEKTVLLGGHKVLGWIYDHVPKPLPTFMEKGISYCPAEKVIPILRVHLDFFTDYVPPQSLIDRRARSVEFLDFLETFKVPIYPQQTAVSQWADFNLMLRVYKAKPEWTINDDEIKRAARENSSDFVEYALGKRTPGKFEGASSWQLIQYNAKLDSNYVPSEEELNMAYHRNDVGLVNFCEQDRFKGLFEQHRDLFMGRENKSLELVKWLWTSKKIEPSIGRLSSWVETGNVEACEWALQNVGQRMRRLRFWTLKIFEKEMIEWWIKNLDKSYIPNTTNAFKMCVYKCNVDSARWIVEKWHLNLSQWEIMDLYRSGIEYCPQIVQSDFIELLRMNCRHIPSTSRWGRRVDHIKVLNRPNFKRILAEHARHPIPVIEWEFIMSLPDLYGIDANSLNDLAKNRDPEVLTLFRKHGLLSDHEIPKDTAKSRVRGPCEGIHGSRAITRVI